MSEKYTIVYVTFPDKDKAESISKALLQERLVACANLQAPHTSHYWWEGQIQSSHEITVLFKTIHRHFEELKEKIKALHPYEVPCIIALPIINGEQAFLNWIEDETQ